MNLAVVDLILVGIFLIFVFLGFKNGMMKSFLYLLSAAVSWFLSAYISKGISHVIYSYFISPSIVENTGKLLSSRSLQGRLIFEKLPDFIADSLPSCGITPEKITHIINSVNKENLPNEISNALMPGITQVLKPMIAVVVFVLLAVVLRFLTRILLKMFKFKALNYGDKILGAIFGALKGFVFILVGLCVIKILIPFGVPSGLEEFTQVASSSSVIFKQLYKENYLYDLVKKI